MKKTKQDPGWKIREALTSLRARIDPYIWDQGQELSKRGAAEDVQRLASGDLQVEVLDPRDARRFFVTVTRDQEGNVTARCPCPYRLAGACRHQVAGLEYLVRIAEGAAAPPPATEARTAGADVSPPPAGEAPARRKAAGPILYRLFGEGAGVATRPDGSLLRAVLHSLGSLATPHRLGLQLFTGTGWTDLRTPDVERWIARGAVEPHARDAALAARFAVDGTVRRELASDDLAGLLSLVAGSDALVDRMGRVLQVSHRPWTLAGRLARGGSGGVSVELACRSAEGESRALQDVSLVPAVAPWIQLETGAFHPLEAGAAGPLLAELQDEDLSDQTGPALDRLLAEGAALLERLCPGGLEVEPGLIEEVEGVSAARVRLEGTPARLAGSLELCYGGDWVPAPETPEPWTVERGGKIHRYPPAGHSIARAERELGALGFRREGRTWILEGPESLKKVLSPRPGAFVSLSLPSRLEALDLVGRAPVLRVKVEAVESGAGPSALAAPSGAEAAGDRAPEAAPAPGRGGSGISWLEAVPSLWDGDRQIALDPSALAGATRGGIVQLGDGTVLSLEHGSVRSLLDLLDAGRSSGAPELAAGSGRVRLPIAWVGEVTEEAPGREVQLDPRVQALVAGLEGGAVLDAAPLRADAAAVLRPYQAEAVRWLGHLARWGLCGILADEMGLGKTVMALVHFFGREGAGAAVGEGGRKTPVLVICPSSLIFNWLDECRRFFPGVEAVGLYGESPAAREALIEKGCDLLVTSYALLRRDREALEARELRAVVLDEAQHIKNASSQTAQAAFALRAPERWVLTGTPVENRLADIWSLFHFLLPQLLGGEEPFREEFADPISRGEDEPLARLRARVRPFLLRRTKAQVLPDLPPRIEQVERAPMTSFQRGLYEAELLRARTDLEGADPTRARMQLLQALTRLRQIACHPRLLLEKEEIAKLGEEAVEATGGKFELLGELLDECIEEGHRVLLYSQWTSMLDLIEERLEERGVVRCRLDGSTRDRQGEVRRFVREASIPVFLISLKAGGFGLNLTQADTVILYDPWWNPAAEDQAAARAHRMGQTLPVHVHKLITAGTVEEKVLDLQARKRDLAGRIVRSEEEAMAALTAEDLRKVLFED